MENSRSQVSKVRIKEPVDLDTCKARINSFWRNKLYSFHYSLEYGPKAMKKRGILKKKKFTSATLLCVRNNRPFNPSNIFSLKLTPNYQNERDLELKLAQFCPRLHHLKIHFDTFVITGN